MESWKLLADFGQTNLGELEHSLRKEILDSGRFVCIEDEKGKEAYLGYLGYRVLKAFYELMNEEKPGSLSWDECLDVIKHNRKARDAAVHVLRISILDFLTNSHFDFQATEVTLISEYEPGEKEGILRSLAFFPVEIGYFIVDWLMLQAEVCQYAIQRVAGNVKSWDAYLDILLQKGDWWFSLRRAFQDALFRFHIKTGWLTDQNLVVWEDERDSE